MVEISEVRTPRELRAFVKFPFRLYQGNSCWVPPIIHDEITTLNRNPAFEHCTRKYWLAKRDGQIVGRIAGIINHAEIRKTGKSTSRFGWMDFVDDPAVSSALFQAVENWARAQSAAHIHGPLGFTDMDKEGLLVEGFGELGTFATIYNHAYYPAHFEANGYRKSIDWVEYELDMPPKMFPRVAVFSRKLAERYQLRQLKLTRASQIKPYAGRVFQLINEAYRDLYGYVELTEKQVKFYTDQYFSFINPDFVSIILNQQDEVVAFGIVMPSLSRAVQKAKGRLFPFGILHIMRAMKKNDRVDLYLIATGNEYRNKGVHVLIFDKLLNTLLKFGVKKLESNPELETNLQVQALWKEFHRRNHKRRRCYAKELV